MGDIREKGGGGEGPREIEKARELDSIFTFLFSLPFLSVRLVSSIDSNRKWPMSSDTRDRSRVVRDRMI